MLKGLFERREGDLDTAEGRFTALRGSGGTDYTGEKMTGMRSPSGAFSIQVENGQLKITAAEGYRGSFQISTPEGQSIDDGGFEVEDTNRTIELNLAKYRGQAVRVSTF